MASELLSDDQQATLQRALPIFDAFGRDVPEHLETPDRQVIQVLGKLDEQITELDALGKRLGSTTTAGKVKEFRKEFQRLEPLADETEPAKQAKAVEKVLECGERVSAEFEVPVREAGVAKALATFKGRNRPSDASKIEGFEKEQKDIAKEADPKKRCDKYFQLERNILKADMAGREADDPGSTWQDRVELALQDARPQGRIDKAGQKLTGVKDAVVSRVTGTPREEISNEDFLAIKTSFENSCAKRIDDLADAVPQAQEQEFRAKAKECVAALVADLFADSRKPADSHLLGKLLMQANTVALQQLTALKRQYPANLTPQVNVEGGKIVITKAAPKVESLVLQGGGGKGAGYPPMLEEMKKAGMLDNVNLLVGTSIEALNASCLACGGLADERQILDMDVFGQGYDSGNFKKQYPEVSFENPSPWLENPKKKLLKKVSNQLPSCAGQMAKMDQLTSASVTENLKGYTEDDLANQLSAKLVNLDDSVLEKLGLAGATPEVIDQQVKNLAKKVKHQDFSSSDRTTQMITFKDLAILHQLDPVNFKELTITGWEGTGAAGHLVYFNAKDFGDMPVALAARISMGLPVFAPLYWQGRGPFFDGGLGSNAPVEATPGLDEFYQGKNPADAEEQLKGDDVPLEVQEAMSKTMLMTFDDEGKGEKNLFEQGRKTTTVSGGEKATLVKTGIQPEYGKTLADDATKVYNGGVNTLEVYHGDLGTLSLGPLAGAEAVEYAENMARMKGLEQLEQRLDQAVAVTCTNTDEALVGLADADKRRLVAAGLPDGADPLVAELYRKCQQYLVLDDAFQTIRGGGDATGLLDLMIASPLCAAAATGITTLRDAYNVNVKGNSNAEALETGLQVVAQGIGGCPAFLRPMLKESVLLPMQKRKRELAKTSGPAPAFLWQQDFSSGAFDNSMSVAARSNVLLYLKEAHAAHDALKAYEKLNDELSAKSKPKEICEAARNTLTALEAFLLALRTMGRVAAYAASPTLQAYIQWLQEKAGVQVDRLRTIVQGKDATYPAHTFVAWDRKDWEQKKQEAIDSGAIEDPGSSGFGSKMEEAVKASAAWNQAGSGAKEQAGKAAWKAWDKFIRLAKAIQGLSENNNFRGYLEDCVTKAGQERAKFGQG